MSAIWGFFQANNNNNNNNSQPSSDSIEAAYQAYRIDRFEKLSASDAFFGCCHQHLTREAIYEKLPYYDKTNQILFTADCVIDNREELIAELGDVSVSPFVQELKVTQSQPEGNRFSKVPPTLILPDAALLYLAHQKWGTDFTTHCLGAYTAAFYFEKEQRLVLYTDHLCNRSLFYAVKDGTFYFSTLIVPLAKELQAKDCEQWMSACLASVSADMMLFESLTPYEGILQMPAASELTWDGKKLTLREYWSPMTLKPDLTTEELAAKKVFSESTKAEEKAAPEKVSYKDTVNNKDMPKDSTVTYRNYFVNTLREATTSMLRSSGETGCTLSGGLDSSSIASLAAPQLAAREKRLYSFTSVPLPEFSSEDDYVIADETEGVKAVCAMYPNIEPEFIGCEGKSAFSALPHLVPLIGYPMKSGQNLTWLDAIYKRAAEKNCKLLLKGQYGNSTISYGPALGTIYQELASGHIKTAKRLINGFSRRYHVSRKTILRFLVKERIQVAFPQNEELTDHLLKQELVEKYKLNRVLNKLNKGSGGGQLDTRKMRLRFIWNPIALQQLSLFDTAMGLIYGILIRDPSKDKRVVEMCCRLPVEHDLAGFLERGKVREYMKDLIPDSIRLDINHRGEQSADYALRCSLLWEQQAPEILPVLKDALTNQYVDKDKLKDLLDTLQNTEPKDISLIDFRKANVLYSAMLLLK